MNPAYRTKLLPVLGLASLALTSALHSETFTLEEATIDQIQAAMEAGALSSVELTSMYLNRISVYDQNGIKFTAVPVVNPEIFDEASAADARRTASATSNPLNGIPIVLKDTMAVNKLTFTQGEKEQTGLNAIKDCFMADKLREAGAIFLGKANLDRAADGYGASDNYGQTLNAYDPTLDPGGSSKGSAVAVALNLATLSLGGETGSSIRWPACSNAAVGVRPTLGLVSSEGVYALGPDRDVVGPITRTVKDSAYVMDVIAEYDPENLLAFRVPVEAYQRSATYVSQLGSKPLSGVRLGVLVQFGAQDRSLHYSGVAPTDRDPGSSIDDETYTSFEKAKQQLRDLGATVVEVDVPALSLWYANDYSNGAFTRKEHFIENGVFAATGLPEDVFDSSYSQYFRGPRAYYWNTMWAEYGDGFITDFRTQYLPTGYLASFWQPDPATYYQTLLDNNLVAPLSSIPYMGAVLSGYDAFYNRYFAQFLNEQNLDATIAPTSYRIPEALGVQQNYDCGNELVNMMGVSGVTVPAPFSSNGLPVGIQFWGRKFDEGKVLAIASAYESGTKNRRSSSFAPALPGETIEYSTATPPATRPELAPPTLRVAGKSNVNGQGSKATVVLSGTAVDASGLASLKVYVNGKKVSAKRARNWRATLKLNALDRLTPAGAKTVAVMVVAKDVYGNTSVAHKRVKLPKNA